MTKLLSLSTLSTLLLASLFFFSCGSDDDSTEETVDYDYHAHINAPTIDNKKVSDTMHIHVTFESHAGEPVHHVNVRVYNKEDNTEVYNQPTEAHVHETSGEYEYHDNLILSNDNGVTGHTDWILEAKVWGKDGAGEVMETVEFHVHPE